MTNVTNLQHKESVAAAFSAAAVTYDNAAFVEQQIALRLLERLEYFNLTPKRILDLGCGTGTLLQQLHTSHPTSHAIGIDLAFGIVKFAKENRNSKNETLQFCCADAEHLPIASNSCDLIVANCSLMWMQDITALLQELTRVLTADGLLIFSTFGPNTLIELGLANNWPEMQMLGDALMHAGLRDPVLETEELTFEYEQLKVLLQDLEESGTCHVDQSQTFPELEQSFIANFEIIYAHAWGSKALHKQYKDSDGKVYVPIAELIK